MRPADTSSTHRARALRKVDNEAEAALWFALRNRKLNGFKFVRQLPVGPYFADFACREQRLVVEVDGSQHAGSASDAVRDRFMAEAGWSVLRLWAADVLRDRNRCLATLAEALEGRQTEPVDAADLRFVPVRRE